MDELQYLFTNNTHLQLGVCRDSNEHISNAFRKILSYENSGIFKGLRGPRGCEGVYLKRLKQFRAVHLETEAAPQWPPYNVVAPANLQTFSG